MKLIAFDLDGTLARPRSSWKYLHQKLGTWKAAQSNAQLFYDKKITWEEWANKDAELWAGIRTDKVEDIAKKYPLTTGAKKTMHTLRNKGFTLTIISGGLSCVAERVGQELGINNIFANKLDSENGLLTGKVMNLVTDVNKCDILSLLLDKLDISLQQTVAVGDDFTMIPMFKIVGLSIAFNPYDLSVAQSAHVTINGKNLTSILPYIL